MKEQGATDIDDLPLDRAEQALRQGDLWRAKEILQGNVRSSGYDPVLFERLGNVLLQMGDEMEAGKYLFLSGIRKSAYAAAIKLYVDRYTSREPMRLYFTFPRAAKLSFLQAYPMAVASELASLGFPENLPKKGKPQSTAASKLGGKALIWGCFLMVLVILCLAIIGAASIVEWGTG